MNSLYVPRILERDGGKVGKRFQEFEVTLIETFRAKAIDQLDDAEAGVAKLYGHSDDGLRFGFRLFVNLGEEARVLRGVLDDDRLTMLRHPTGDSLPDLDANVFQGLGCFADRQLEIEFLLGLIQQKQRPVSRAQKLVNFLHDGAENLVELQRRRQRLPQLLEDGDFTGFALLSGNRGIAAAFHGWKLLYFVHARLIPAMKFLQARPSRPRKTTPRARFGASPRIFASIGASQKRVQDSRGTGVAILPSAGTGGTGKLAASSDIHRTNELWAPSRKTRQPESMSCRARLLGARPTKRQSITK